MNPRRLQLTLFLDEKSAGTIERVRREFNPAQYELIKAHVTLCREHELEQIEKVIANLKNCDHQSITINFGNPTRFSDGKGVLLPGTGNLESFQQLRKKIIQRIVEAPGNQEPHITLLHPRNSTCTDEQFEQLTKIVFPTAIEFSRISLIEQEWGKKWHVLEEFALNNMKTN